MAPSNRAPALRRSQLSLSPILTLSLAFYVTNSQSRCQCSLIVGPQARGPNAAAEPSPTAEEHYKTTRRTLGAIPKMRAGSEVLTLRGAPQLREVHYCATDDAYKLQGLWYLYGEGWMGEWNYAHPSRFPPGIVVVNPFDMNVGVSIIRLALLGHVDGIMVVLALEVRLRRDGVLGDGRRGDHAEDK